MNLSIHRIWYLFKIQWVENRKLYTLGLLAMVCIIALLFFGGGESANSQSEYFFIGLILSSSMFSSSILSRFSEKNKALSALMLPASAAEKTIVAIIYSTVIFPVVYFILIYPVMMAAHYYHIEIKGDLAPMWSMGNAQGEGITIVLYFIMQPFVLFCSAMFRRFTFVKTAVLLCMLILGTVLLNDKMYEQLYKRRLQPKVLPQGFIRNPPDYIIETETRVIAPPKGSKEAPKKITSAPKKVLVPADNFDSAAGDPFTEGLFYSRNKDGIHNARVWKAELPTRQQSSFNLLFILIVPFFWLLTWLKLKEKTLV
jgi:hypothetical protein